MSARLGNQRLRACSLVPHVEITPETPGGSAGRQGGRAIVFGPFSNPAVTMFAGVARVSR
jgi:hypothetical protein